MLYTGFNFLLKFNNLSWPKFKQLHSFYGYAINVVYGYIIIYFMNPLLYNWGVLSVSLL